MHKLVKICRTKILPLLDDNLLALVEIVAETIVTGARQLPVKIAEIEKEKIKSASDVLKHEFGNEKINCEFLGYLYESLIEKRIGKDKQTERRRSGAFYTPEYIAEFLVKASFDAASHISGDPPRVLDPACGCGAFLIAAWRELRKKFPRHDRRKIISRCLFGVDTDPIAVHIARISLWLESGLENAGWQTLEVNIREGDSLRNFIETDFERFDVVVGNPPYRNVKRGIPDDLKEFCKLHYRTAIGQWDLAAPFVELALERLLKPGGAMGYVLPNPVLLAENYAPVREIILKNDPVSFGPAGMPFKEPGVEASLLVVRTGESKRGIVTILDGREGKKIRSVRKLTSILLHRLPFNIFSHRAEADELFPIFDSLASGKLIRLGDIVNITRGLEFGKKDRRIVPFTENIKGAYPLIVGESVNPFRAIPTFKFAPSIDSDLDFPKKPDLWAVKRQLLIRRVARRPIAAVVDPPKLVLNTIYIAGGIGFDEHSLCALINSDYFAKLFIMIYAFDDTLFPYLRISQLSRMPIPADALNDRTLSDLSMRLHKMAGEGKDIKNDPEGSRLMKRVDEAVRELYS